MANGLDVGEIVQVLQKTNLEENHWLFSRTTSVGRILFGEQISNKGKIDVLRDFS
jgi:hypothetical protein